MIIIGINAYHGDSSACVLKDGQLVAAVEEERFRRIKHWTGFPSLAIRYCLQEAKCELSDVDYIAMNRKPTANFLRKIVFGIKNRPDIGLVYDRLKNAKKWISVNEHLSSSNFGSDFSGEICHIEHHDAHLASAFFASPYSQAHVISVDAMGDFASCAWGVGQDEEILRNGTIYFPHSLGAFYTTLTQYLGFYNFGDEYKVMGLAPYGNPTHIQEMRKIVNLKSDGNFELSLDYFNHHLKRTGRKWDSGMPTDGFLVTSQLEELLGPRRKPADDLCNDHMNIARSVQAMYEEALWHLLRHKFEQHPIRSLCLAGGCAMNSVANGKITQMTPFEKVYVPSAAGDAGGAIGAAYSVWYKNGGGRCAPMDHAYWGPEFDAAAISELLDAKESLIRRANCSIRRSEDSDGLAKHVASAIADGKVVGWFQGRMEWGPRALGNRSILCDPRRADMKDILNSKIKRRESFRPFAPSVLREAVANWFEQDDDVPFMMKVFQVRAEKRDEIPAVTHVDGSGRLQTVSRDSNPLYHRLISSFAAQTGVPMLLNTSFNENEPIVCRPEEALDCFLRTNMDVLVIGSYLIERQP